MTTGPRILLNTIALDPNRWTEEKIPYFKLTDLLPAIAGHGFSDIEIWQYHVDRLSRPEVEALRSVMEARGVSARVLGIYPRIHLTGEERRNELSHVVRLLDTARFLGADMVKLFVGSVASGRLDAEGLEQSVSFLKEMSERAESRGIRLTGETHANTLFDTVSSTLGMLEQLHASNFGACFQPYDASLPGATGAFTALRAWIWHLHFQGRKEGAISLLEEADLDYAEYTRFVARSGFSGYLCIEFVKDCVVPSPELLDVEKVLANAEKDREFVRRHLEL